MTVRLVDGLSADSDNQKLRTTIWLLLVLGVAFTVVNLKWPIGRNALCYAKASLGLIQNHFNVFAIARDHTWTAGKPILFTMVAAPLVYLFGVNLGTIFASFLGTTFFLCMSAIALPRLNRLSGINPELLRLELAFVMLNPLTIYQFWSGYPDSLFAGLVILCFVLIDIVVTEPERDTRWQILGSALTILVAIHTKLYGATLLGMCGAYFLCFARSFVKRARYRTPKLVLLLVSMILIGGILLAAKCGMYPLLDFNEGAGFDSYMNGLFHSEFVTVFLSLKMLAFTILLSFQFALLFLIARTGRHAWSLAPTLFISIYVLGLLIFPGTSYNMRYFLPVFVFLAPPLAARAESLRIEVRRIILGLYLALASLLILAFNFAPAQRAVAPSIAMASKKYFRINLWLDNLRLQSQMAIWNQIESINKQVPAGAVLYWSSNYYGTTTHGMAEHLGVKHGIDIRYVLNDSDVVPQANPIFLVEFTAETPPDTLKQPLLWAKVTCIGPGLFRLDPTEK